MDRLELLMTRFATESLGKKHGLILEKLREGHAVIRYTALKEDCVINDKGQGIVQGGVIGGVLADFAAVYSAMSAIPAGHTPLMVCNFSMPRPTLENETVFAEATVINISKSMISVTVKISDCNSKLKCEGSYYFGNPKL